MKLTSRQVGAVGVARVTGALLRCGYNVLTPYEDFAGYDVVAEKDGKFHRIQVKTAQAVEAGRTKYRFTTCSGNGFNIPKRPIAGVDYVALWAMTDDSVLVVTHRQVQIGHDQGLSHRQGKAGGYSRTYDRTESVGDI
jgi:hypothetical protein